LHLKQVQLNNFRYWKC